MAIGPPIMFSHAPDHHHDYDDFPRGERERLFGSREREGKLKIPSPFYGKGTGIRKCYGKGREWEIRGL